MSEKSKRLPLAKLRETEEFQLLTLKQQLFVTTYCEGGILDGHYDPVGSAQTAYQCKSREIARVMSYSLLTNLRIVAVLNLHFAREPIEDFLLTLNRAIRNKKLTIAQFKALQLKAQLMGFGSRLPGVDNQDPSVIPPDVLARDKEERKKHRKARASKPHGDTAPSDLDLEASRF